MHRIDLNDQEKSDFARKEHLSDQRTQILLYKDLSLIDQYIFSGTKITVGKGRDADLILADPRLADIQVIIHIQNDNIIISDQSNKLAVYLNGKPVKAAVLEPLDLVEIGDYGLKIQIVKNFEKVPGKNKSAKFPRKSSASSGKNGGSPKKFHRTGAAAEFFKRSSCNTEKQVLPGALKRDAKPKSLEDNGIQVDFPSHPPYRKMKISRLKTPEEFIGVMPEKTKNYENVEELFSLPSLKDQRRSLPKLPKRPVEKISFVSEDEDYLEEFFKLPSDKNQKRPTETANRRPVEKTLRVSTNQEFPEKSSTTPFPMKKRRSSPVAPKRPVEKTLWVSADQEFPEKSSTTPPPMKKRRSSPVAPKRPVEKTLRVSADLEFPEKSSTTPSPMKKRRSSPVAPKRPVEKSLRVSADPEFPEKSTTAPSPKKRIRSSPAISKPSAKRSSRLPVGEDYSEDFFKLPPYKKTSERSVSETTAFSLDKLVDTLEEDSSEELFKLPPSKKKPEQSFSETTAFSLGKLVDTEEEDDYSEDFFTLPPYKPLDETIAGERDHSAPGTAPQSLARHYDLVFSGKLKHGWTLLRVKSSLNQRFGVDYRQLASLVLDRKIVVKRNLSHAKAVKLRDAFDICGAICRIVPVKAPFDDPDGGGRKAEKGSDSAGWRREAEKLSSIFGGSSRLFSNPEKTHKKIARPTPRSNATISAKAEKSSASKKVLSFFRSKTARNRSRKTPPSDPEEWKASERFNDTREMLLDDDLKEHTDADGRSAFRRRKVEKRIDKRRKPLETVKSASKPIRKSRTENEKPAGKAVMPSGPHNVLSMVDYWDNGEDDDDFPAPFRLKDRLVISEPHRVDGRAGNGCIEVMKILNRSVVDVSFLNKGEKYFIRSDGRHKFKLAENRGGKKCFYYSDQRFQTAIATAGAVLENNPSHSSSLRSFGSASRRNRQVINSQHLIKLNDGCFEYRLRRIAPAPSPKVRIAVAEKGGAWRHMLHSAVFHVVLLLFTGLIPWTTVPDSPEPESRFVQIDPELLADLQKPEDLPQKIELKPREIEPVEPLETPPPPAPKKKTQPPKPQKAIAKKKAVVKPKRVATAKTSTKKSAAVSRDSHPNAGGGAGKGNVVNRDIKQVGLLSMIGDSVGIQPQVATAAVTNLDAVASPGAGESNFKVGGIAAKLGTGKIAVPSGGYVATKGSTQVLRSTGASGPGRVAALERGNSGDRQVKGMVSAEMSRKVNIQGGMSREAVKRVIDQHLDEISYCYETALVNNPSIMGRMTYEWKIKSSGDVGAVNIKSSTINSHDIHACIKAAIKTWKFPQPQGSEVVVSYPFIFDIVGF